MAACSSVEVSIVTTDDADFWCSKIWNALAQKLATSQLPYGTTKKMYLWKRN